MELTSNERTIIELLRSDHELYMQIAKLVVEKLTREVEASKEVLDEKI